MATVSYFIACISCALWGFYIGTKESKEKIKELKEKVDELNHKLYG